MDNLFKHLELPHSHARVLFAGSSSVFNTMQPHVLAQKRVQVLVFTMTWSCVFFILFFYGCQQVFTKGNHRELLLVLDPPTVVPFLPCSTFCIQMTVVVTKRTVTWLHLVMTVLYFLSFWNTRWSRCSPPRLHRIDLNVNKTKESIINFRRQGYTNNERLVVELPCEG